MKPAAIVIHHSLTKDSKSVSWSAIRRYHKQTCGWREIGYHYGIEMVGTEPEIFVGRMMNEYGAHCKDSGMNRISLGICLVGNFDEEAPPTILWERGLVLVRSLLDLLDISPSDVYGHRDFSDKSCPGDMFDMDQFRKDLI